MPLAAASYHSAQKNAALLELNTSTRARDVEEHELDDALGERPAPLPEGDRAAAE